MTTTATRCSPLLALGLSPVLAVTLLVLANPVRADPYDPQVATGALQTVCKDFAINSGVLSAKCNKVEAGGLIGLVDASIDLEIDERCRSGATISVTANAVTLKGDCEVPPGADELSIVETDLNDVIEWGQSESKFRWKSTTAVRAPSSGNLAA